MTKACKCDRCGELFPIREDSTLYRIERYESDREYEEVDLCDVCMRAFEYWMEAATKSEDIPEKPEKLLIKDKPLEMRFAGFSPHDDESRWVCPNPDCDHVYGSWWFYIKKLHAHDTFVCEGCHQLLEVPETQKGLV